MAAENYLSPQKIIETKTVEVLKNPQTWQKQTEREVKEDFSELDKLRFKDIDWRLNNRESFKEIANMEDNIVAWVEHTKKSPPFPSKASFERSLF